MTNRFIVTNAQSGKNPARSISLAYIEIGDKFAYS